MSDVPTRLRGEQQRFSATRKAVDAFFAEHPDIAVQTVLSAVMRGEADVIAAIMGYRETKGCEEQ